VAAAEKKSKSGKQGYRYAAFGGQFRRWREAAGLTREEVIARCNGAIKYPRLARIELGDIHVGPSVAAYLAPAVGRTAEALLEMRDSAMTLAKAHDDDARYVLEELSHYDEEEQEFVGTVRWLLEGDVVGGRWIATSFILGNLDDELVLENLLPLARERGIVSEQWRPGPREALLRAVGTLELEEVEKTYAFVQGLLAARSPE
jgi:transcriptional regulator with XRE-family HTH domain